MIKMIRLIKERNALYGYKLVRFLSDKFTPTLINEFTMKRSLLLILLFLNPLLCAKSFSQTVVTSLNMDQCWVGPVEESELKIVNFGERNAYQLDGHLFQELLEKIQAQVAPYGLLKAQNSFETLIHCSAAYTSLVLNVKTANQRFCVWAKMGHENLEILTLGVEPMAHEGWCSGAALGQGLITLTSPEKIEDLSHWLIEQKLISSREQVRVIRDDLVTVNFQKDFYFQEEQLINRMNQELVAKGIVKFAELNTFSFQNGEFLKVEELGGQMGGEF